MKAAFLAVGSELLSTDRLDTNSLRVAELLARHGVEMARKAVVGDDEEEIARELDDLLGRFPLVVVTGGLGPTADDVTREAAARALGRELIFRREIVDDIEAKFRRVGRRMSGVNRRQALVVEGAEVLANAWGTAPGLRLESRAEGGDGAAATLFLLPGVPRELEKLMAAYLEPWLAERSAGLGRERRVLKVACLPESTVEERIAPAYGEFGREGISVLASPGEIRLQLTAAGTGEQRRARLDAVEARLAELVGAALFARREEDTLEAVVGELLRRAGATVVTAESCTGGLVAERFTRVAGSSDYFLGAAVTYSNDLKARLLGVPRRLLAEHGAVSEVVARAMARGARAALGADYALALTGVAGPGGGSEAKPVGTVHVALAAPGGETLHLERRFPGDRQRVRQQSAQLALEMLRRRLLGIGLPAS